MNTQPTPYPLPSEAYRRGRLTSSAGPRLQLINDDGTSCAYGAILIGADIKPYTEDENEFSAISQKSVQFPCECVPSHVKADWSAVLVHLYDDHVQLNPDFPETPRWTEERVIEWLEHEGL